MPSSRSTRRRRSLSDAHPHLTQRDRRLLARLAEHRVLTTTQVSDAFFGKVVLAQERLRVLAGLELVARLAQPRDRRRGGSRPALWTLGRVGLDWAGVARGDPDKVTRLTSPMAAELHTNRVSTSRLSHLLGTNGFFTALLAYQRTHRRERAWLARWWSEARCWQEFGVIHPDGHGLWSGGQDEPLTGFYLEFDLGGETLGRLAEKLADYDKAPQTLGGVDYPVLFSLGSAVREANFHAKLAEVAFSSVVATTVRPTVDPAAAVWAVAGRGLAGRVRLADLPSQHGENKIFNPNWHHDVLLPDIYEELNYEQYGDDGLDAGIT